MKKMFATLVMASVFAMSVNVYAEGQLPIGGRSCPPSAPPSECSNLVNNPVETNQSETDIIFQIVRNLRFIFKF